VARQQCRYKERPVLERRLRRAGIKALEPRAGRVQESPDRRPLDHSSSPEVFLSASASSFDHRPELVIARAGEWRGGSLTRRQHGVVDGRQHRSSSASIFALQNSR
jgi:hypothetical protein